MLIQVQRLWLIQLTVQKLTWLSLIWIHKVPIMCTYILWPFKTKTALRKENKLYHVLAKTTAHAYKQAMERAANHVRTFCQLFFFLFLPFFILFQNPTSPFLRSMIRFQSLRPPWMQTKNSTLSFFILIFSSLLLLFLFFCKGSVSEHFSADFLFLSVILGYLLEIGKFFGFQ